MIENKYSYNFSWLGRQIIQEPLDIVCLQEVIWKVKPDLIIETGIAHGGSLVLSASMLAMLDFEKYIPNRKAIGIDIEIRQHNLKALVTHPLRNYFTLIEASSTEKETIRVVTEIAGLAHTVMVILDSDHTHNHVLAELEAYAPLVTKGSYCVVFDTGIEDTPPELCFGKPWGKGNNPKTAVWEFLKHHPEFESDKEIERKLIVTSSPDGWLKRVK